MRHKLDPKYSIGTLENNSIQQAKGAEKWTHNNRISVFWGTSLSQNSEFVGNPLDYQVIANIGMYLTAWISQPLTNS